MMARPRKNRVYQTAVEQETGRLVVVAPAPLLSKSCLTCEHRHNNGAYDECRRYPPPFALLSQSDWCGEFKAK